MQPQTDHLPDAVERLARDCSISLRHAFIIPRCSTSLAARSLGLAVNALERAAPPRLYGSSQLTEKTEDSGPQSSLVMPPELLTTSVFLLAGSTRGRTTVSPIACRFHARSPKAHVVDEYQDVNPLQEELIRILHRLGANLCVVGDDDQTIYQWRGSEVENIIHFSRRYPGVSPVRLDQNFRSSKGVVLAARQVIERNPDRLPKKMESTDAQKYGRGDVLALQFPDVPSEVQWIARKIRSLIGTPYKDRPDRSERGFTYSDFAVLLRSVKNDGKPIVDALRAAKIPVLVGGVSTLFDTCEMQAVRELFYFLAGYSPRNVATPTIASLRRQFRQTWWGIKKSDLEKGLRFLEEKKARIGHEMNAELYLQRVYQDFLAILKV